MKLKNIVVVFLIICVFLLFFTNVKDIKATLKDSFLFTVTNVICSIFPFMMLSSFLINSYIIEKQLHSLDFKRLNKLGVCKIYLPSILLGSVSGFVTGAKCINELYSINKTDKNSFTNAVILSSNAGVGFVIVCVGMKIWDSALYGILLYICQITTSLLIGKFILPDAKNEYKVSQSQKTDYIKSFTDAVSSSAQSVILIIAFISTFSVLITAISSLFGNSLKDTASSFLYILIEFCNGSFEAVSFENILLCAFLTGFTVGFGGLCVHFQIFSVCNGSPLNKRLFVLAKLLHGIILGAVSLILVSIMKISPCISVSIHDSNSSITPLTIIILMLIFFYYVINAVKSRA